MCAVRVLGAACMRCCELPSECHMRSVAWCVMSRTINAVDVPIRVLGTSTTPVFGFGFGPSVHLTADRGGHEVPSRGPY
eukprot:3618443-Prymnesium_polylepis.1